MKGQLCVHFTGFSNDFKDVEFLCLCVVKEIDNSHCLLSSIICWLNGELPTLQKPKDETETSVEQTQKEPL